MKRIIKYFSICGYEEDGTPEYKISKWVCEDMEEFIYAMECIDEEDIISIKAKRTIKYFSICGYEEDGTPKYEVLKWVCEGREEFEYAMKSICEHDIISID